MKRALMKTENFCDGFTTTGDLLSEVHEHVPV